MKVNWADGVWTENGRSVFLKTPQTRPVTFNLLFKWQADQVPTCEWPHTISQWVTTARLQSNTAHFLPGGWSPVCRRFTKCSMSFWTSHSSSDFLTSSYSYKRKGEGRQLSNSQKKGGRCCKFLWSTVVLHLVAGHTLLGQLVEVSPHHVSQEVYPLFRLCFKHLLGKDVTDMFSSDTTHGFSLAVFRWTPQKLHLARVQVFLQPVISDLGHRVDALLIELVCQAHTSVRQRWVLT